MDRQATPSDVPGHSSTRILLGGAAFGQVTQAEADAAFELAFPRINHVDLAASYGEAEGPPRQLDRSSWQAVLSRNEDGGTDGGQGKRGDRSLSDRLQRSQVIFCSYTTWLTEEMADGPGTGWSPGSRH